MKENIKEIIKKSPIKVIVLIIVMITIFIGITYAFINTRVSGTIKHIIKAGTLMVELEEVDALIIEDALPMYDEVGKIQEKHFAFRVSNNSSQIVNYKLYLKDITETNKEKLNYEDVKYFLTKENTEYYQQRLSERDGDLIDEDRLEAGEVKEYTLRFWIRDGVMYNEEIEGKTLKFKLVAEVTTDIRERYDIRYQTGVEGITMGSATKIEGEDFILPSTTLQREGYIFFGWSTKENSEVAEFAPSGTYQENKSTVFYAVWVKDTYIVEYDANTGINPPAAQEKKYNEDLTLTSETPEKPGHSFQGWSTSANGEVEYNPGDTYQGNSNLKLYAIWKVDTYTISYDANGGEGGPISQNKTFDQDITLDSTNIPARQYYIFLGWSTEKTATEAMYNPGDIYKEEGNKTLYAVWESITKPTTKSGSFTATITNWMGGQKLIPFGCIYISNPTINLSESPSESSWSDSVVSNGLAAAVIQWGSSSMSGGSKTESYSISGTAYIKNAPYKYVSGSFTATISNWTGGSKTINFGTTFSSIPTVQVAKSRSDLSVTVSNITTTSCTISWGSSSASGGNWTIEWGATGGA